MIKIFLINILFFLYGSLFGWLLELMFGIFRGDKKLITRNRCGDTVVRDVLRKCFPFLSIYGIGFLLVINIYLFFHSRLSIFWIIFVCFLVVVILECLIAVINYRVFNKKTWDYDTNLCYGGIGYIQSLYWLILMSVVIFLFDRFLPVNLYSN